MAGFFKVSNGTKLTGGTGCIAVVLLLLLNFLVGGYFVNYTLTTVFGKTLGFFWGGFIGLVFGEIAFFTALISLVVHLLGVHLPLIALR